MPVPAHSAAVPLASSPRLQSLLNPRAGTCFVSRRRQILSAATPTAKESASRAVGWQKGGDRRACAVSRGGLLA